MIIDECLLSYLLSNGSSFSNVMILVLSLLYTLQIVYFGVMVRLNFLDRTINLKDDHGLYGLVIVPQTTRYLHTICGCHLKD